MGRSCIFDTIKLSFRTFGLKFITYFFPKYINCRVPRHRSHKRNLTNISCRFTGNPLYATSRASYEPNSPETTRNDNNFPWYVVTSVIVVVVVVVQSARNNVFISSHRTARLQSTPVNFADACICISRKCMVKIDRFSRNWNFVSSFSSIFLWSINN